MLLSRVRSVCAGRRGRTPMGVAHPTRTPRAARAASVERARCILLEFPQATPAIGWAATLSSISFARVDYDNLGGEGVALPCMAEKGRPEYRPNPGSS